MMVRRAGSGSRGSASLKDSVDHDHDRCEKQKVDQTSECEMADEAEDPQEQKHERQRPKHGIAPS
jgi:hypothetical protein